MRVFTSQLPVSIHIQKCCTVKCYNYVYYMEVYLYRYVMHIIIIYKLFYNNHLYTLLNNIVLQTNNTRKQTIT